MILDRLPSVCAGLACGSARSCLAAAPSTAGCAAATSRCLLSATAAVCFGGAPIWCRPASSGRCTGLLVGSALLLSALASTGAWAVLLASAAAVRGAETPWAGAVARGDPFFRSAAPGAAAACPAGCGTADGAAAAISGSPRVPASAGSARCPGAGTAPCCAAPSPCCCRDGVLALAGGTPVQSAASRSACTRRHLALCSWHTSSCQRRPRRTQAGATDGGTTFGSCWRRSLGPEEGVARVPQVAAPLLVDACLPVPLHDGRVQLLCLRTQRVSWAPPACLHVRVLAAAGEAAQPIHRSDTGRSARRMQTLGGAAQQRAARPP